MLRVLKIFVSFFLFPCLAHCSPYSNKFPVHVEEKAIKIVNIEVEKFSEHDFKRIREYFNGGHEYQGQKCIVRDNPNNRGGLYFIVNFNKPLNLLPKNVSVNMYLMIGKALEYEKFSFALPNKRPSFSSEVHLGVTSKKVDPSEVNAWKIELVGPDGAPIATDKSYMWPNGY